MSKEFNRDGNAGSWEKNDFDNDGKKSPRSTQDKGNFESRDRDSRPPRSGGFGGRDKFERKERSDRGEGRFDRGDRPRFDRDRPRRESFGREGGFGSQRPRFDRDRPPRKEGEFNSDRPRRENFDRDGRGGAPRFDRSDRPRREGGFGSDRPRFDRDGRGGRDGAPRFERNDRDGAPRFDRGDRPRREGGFGSDRPRFDRDGRDGAPRFDRDRPPRREGGFGSDRPRFDRDRPRFDRDRPRFDRDRPRRESFGKEGGFGSDRPRRESFGRDGFDRDNRGENSRFERNEHPRFDRPSFERVENQSVEHDNLEYIVDAQAIDGATNFEAHEQHSQGSQEAYEGIGAENFNADRPRRESFGRDGFDRDRPRRESFGRDGFGGDRPRREGSGREGFGGAKFGDKGRGGKPFRERSDFEEVLDLDKGILKLLAKRARFLKSMVDNKTLDASKEKDIRLSWEGHVTKFCPDPKVMRELFNLIQSVEATGLSDLDQPSFNLSPAPKPVQVELPAPASSRIARYYLALAAASGQETSMKHIALTDSMIDCIKSLNVMGGDLWYENDGTVLSRASKGLERGGDKFVHVGKDPLNLWFSLALSLGLPYHVKFTGENELRNIDFAPISHFAPKLGARFVQVIPSQEGLPIRIEASGMLPEEVVIPADLPRDFVLALFLAAPFWDSSIRFNMDEYFGMLHETGQMQEWKLYFEELWDVIRSTSLNIKRDEATFIIEKGAVQLPQEVLVPSDAEICATFFLLPALTSGYVQLEGVWQDLGQQRMLKEMMDFLGLECTVIENSMRVSGISDTPVNMPESGELPKCPVAISTLLHLIAASKGTQIDITGMEGFEENKDIITSFLAHIGFDEKFNRIEAEFSAWLAPSAVWAVAFALGAYIRPRLKLVNPNILNDYYPFYWRMYNTLPRPELTKPERKRETVTKRRVIAQGSYADLSDAIDFSRIDLNDE